MSTAEQITREDIFGVVHKASRPDAHLLDERHRREDWGLQLLCDERLVFTKHRETAERTVIGRAVTCLWCVQGRSR